MSKTVQITLKRHADVVRMPIQNLHDWIEHLSSGNILQGDSMLVNTTNPEKPLFCCLGVYAHYVDGINLDIIENKSDITEILIEDKMTILDENEADLLHDSTYMINQLDTMNIAEIVFQDMEFSDCDTISWQSMTTLPYASFKAAQLNDSTSLYIDTNILGKSSLYVVNIQLEFKEIAELLFEGAVTKEFKMTPFTEL